jgi:hypothetical protein
MESESLCAGCGQHAAHRAWSDGKFYGIKCCYVGPKCERSDALLHKLHPVPLHPRLTHADFMRLTSRRASPDGTAHTLKRWARKGDFTR